LPVPRTVEGFDFTAFGGVPTFAGGAGARLETPAPERAGGFLTFVGPTRFAAVFAMVRV